MSGPKIGCILFLEKWHLYGIGSLIEVLRSYLFLFEQFGLVFKPVGWYYDALVLFYLSGLLLWSVVVSFYGSILSVWSLIVVYTGLAIWFYSNSRVSLCSLYYRSN